ALLLVVAVLFGVLDALYYPASATLPRQMVRPEDLPATQALFEMTGRVAVLAGGPLGGLLVGLGGIRSVMVLDAASFAVIAAYVAVGVHPRFPLDRSRGRS